MWTLRQERDGLLIGPYESEHVMVLPDLDHISIIYVSMYQCINISIRHITLSWLYTDWSLREWTHYGNVTDLDWMWICWKLSFKDKQRKVKETLPKVQMEEWARDKVTPGFGKVRLVVIYLPWQLCLPSLPFVLRKIRFPILFWILGLLFMVIVFTTQKTSIRIEVQELCPGIVPRSNLFRNCT